MHEDKNLVPYHSEKIIGAIFTPQGRKNFDAIDWHRKEEPEKPAEPAPKEEKAAES